ncbi:hypothetical protein CUR178_07518 [Leishmania enriettii]|uniref:Uncharacterized protein n=1 Tax=Leishmania enriettii TaxID=5663 RepID=A0A836H4X2_LEIEN|nr:hypothetical protein CUR178_07518 [Leishmania enriettii]
MRLLRIAAHTRQAARTSQAESPVNPPATEAPLSMKAQLAYTAYCRSTEWPSSQRTLPSVDDAVSSFSSCVGNNSAATTCRAAVSEYGFARQALAEDIQSAVLHAATVQQAKRLLRDFESYQRSVGAAQLTRAEWCAILPPGCAKGAGGAVRTEKTPSLDVAASGQHGALSVADSTEVHGCVGNAGIRPPVQPPLASPSPLPSLTIPLDPAALALAKRRAAQALYCNAQARAVYADRELQRSRAVRAGILKRPGVVAEGVLASGGSSSRPVSTARGAIDGQALRFAAGAGDAPRTSHVRAPPIEAKPGMSEAERAASIAEAERALSLLQTIRAMHQQTEELTVLLLHACGAWGFWSRPAANAAAPSGQTDVLLPSSLLSGGTKHAQHLFADLFLAAPPRLTELPTSPPDPMPSVSDGFFLANLLSLGPADDVDTTRRSAAGDFAKESARRRERACRVLRQTLQQQQQRWSLCRTADATAAAYAAATAAPEAGAAFLEMASTPPQRAVPPPPPMSVQLDLYAAQQSDLRCAAQWWQGRAAQAAATSAAEGGGASSKEAATPYGPLQQQLHTLITQQRELQHSCDVLRTTAVQRRRASTYSRAFKSREVQPRETITVLTENADARCISHATRGTSRATPDAASEIRAPALPPPGFSSPGAAAPEAQHQGPSPLPRQHCSPAASRRSEITPPSDTLPITSVQPVVDRTWPWVDPPTVLEASASELLSRSTDIPRAAAATPMSAEVSMRGARAPVQQAGQLAAEEEGAESRCAKGDAGLAVREEAHISAVNLKRSRASADAILSNSTRAAIALSTTSSSSLRPLPSPTADVRDGVVGVLPEICEASGHLCANAMPSTHPVDAWHGAVGLERGHAAQHQEGRRRRRGDRGGSTAVEGLTDSVRSHLSRCISRQQKSDECDGAAPSSPPALSPQVLTAATAGVRSTSPQSAASEVAAEPPSAVVRALKHQLQESVAPSSRNSIRVVASAAVIVDADQSDGSRGSRASLQQRKGWSSTIIASVIPSRRSTAAASPELTAVKLAAQSPPHAAVADATASPLPTLSARLRAGASAGASNAGAAPLSRPPLASAAAAHSGLAPACVPPLLSLPNAKLAGGGGSVGVAKLPQRQCRRNFFSRLFSCGC